MNGRVITCFAISAASLSVFSWFSDLYITGVLGTAILIHELGHWLWFRLCKESAYVVITPFAGFTMPDEPDILDYHAHFWLGLMFLSGCTFSLLVAWSVIAVTGLLGISIYGSFVEYTLLFMLAMNLLNLLMIVPVTDGGRIFMILFSRSHILTLLSTFTGMACCVLVKDLIGLTACIIIIAVSLLLYPLIRSEFKNHRCPVNASESVYLLLLWVAIILLSVTGLTALPKTGHVICRIIAEKGWA